MSYAAVVNGGSRIGNNFDRSLTGGFLVHALFMPILTFALTPESKGRAVCGNAARTDLCGGCRATSIPTATRSADSAAGMGGGVSRPLCQPFWHESDKSQGFGDSVPK